MMSLNIKPDNNTNDSTLCLKTNSAKDEVRKFMVHVFGYYITGLGLQKVLQKYSSEPHLHTDYMKILAGP